MIEIVFMFGAINVVFEFVLLCMMPPRFRLRLLGNHHSQMLLHVGFLLLNLMIHWGTIVGTTSSILAFICSMVTVRIAQTVFGHITDGRHYTTGWIRFAAKDLK